MRKRSAGMLLATASVGIAAQCVLGASLSATWTGAAGNWTTAANWSSNPQFPNNVGGNTWTATVINPAARIALDAPIAVDRYQQFDGRLDTTGNSLAVANHLQWDGGEIIGAGTINIANTLALHGGPKRISAVTINAAATCVTSWLGGTIDQTDVEGGTFNNAGVFNDLTDDSWVWLTQQTPVLNNIGTYSKLIGAPLSGKQVQAQFNNSGTVNVAAGDLWLSGGGESGGTFSVAAGARLILSDFAEHFSGAGAINTILQAGSRVNANGEVLFSNLFGNAVTHIHGRFDAAILTVDPGILGEVRFHPNALLNQNIVGQLDVRRGRLMLDTLQAGGVAFSALTMSGGQIEGSDEVRIVGAMTWSGGSIRGAGQIFRAVGGLTMTGAGNKFIIRRAFHNDGGAASSGGPLLLDSADVLNRAGAHWTAIGEFDVLDAGGTFRSRFFNHGSFIKATAGTTTSLAEVEFNNTGTVSITGGVLALGGGGSSGGTFTISSTGELRLEGSLGHLLSSAAVITGPAGSRLTFAQDAQTVSVAGIHVDTIELRDSGRLFTGGTVRSGRAIVSNNAGVVFNAGTFETGTLTIAGGGQLSTVMGGGTTTISAAALEMPDPPLSRIDLFDDRMIIDYTGSSPIASIRPLIQIGYSGGGWTGNGITSTAAQLAALTSTRTGIGYAQAADVFTGFPASFGGYWVDASSVLLSYTLLGDATLDRTVNIADFAAMGVNFNAPGLWINGDFNYDALVGISDFALLASNFNKTVAGDVIPRPVSSVPEPAGAVAWPAVVWAWVGVRRRG